MTEQNSSVGHEAQPWYVMCHIRPRQIETMLQKDSAGLFAKPDETPLPPYRFYVPFQNIPIRSSRTKNKEVEVSDKHYIPQKDVNALRDDLHNFVFIQASEERISAIVHADWNSKAQRRLYHYRDTNNRVVTIPDVEMRQLMATIQDRHLQFYIDQPLDDFVIGDKVILKMEPWTGHHGDITKIAIKHGQLCMTISMNILGRTKSINFTDVQVGDVIFEDSEQGRLLSSNPISNYEEEIIDILSHRFGRHRNNEMTETDRQRLRRLVTYNHIYVDDADEHARFTALKLICAYLLQSAKKRDHYQQQALALLHQSVVPSPSGAVSSATVSSPLGEVPNTVVPSPSGEVSNAVVPSPLGEVLPLAPQTDSEAYLMTALFITTRQAHWRTALKDYRKTHPDCPDVFRRYHAILKDLRAKKNTKKPRTTQ